MWTMDMLEVVVVREEAKRTKQLDNGTRCPATSVRLGSVAGQWHNTWNTSLGTASLCSICQMKEPTLGFRSNKT